MLSPAILLALIALGGLALRLALLIHAGWRYDYDEGMVGLQVLRILRGARPIFHPGQPYLAALESYLIAPWFALLGANAITLKLVPWLLSGGYILTTARLGELAFDRRVGMLSALFAAAAPSYLLVTGMKTWGATAETLLLGNLCLIAASNALGPHRSHADSQRAARRAMLTLGFFGGIAFWVSWLIAFYAIPIGIILIWRGRPLLRRHGPWAVAAFFAGSAPFWGYNLAHDWATFRYLFSDQGETWDNLLPVLRHLNNDLAPRMVSGDPDWRLLSWPAIWWLQLVYEGGLLLLVVAGWRSRHETKQPAQAMLALFVLGLPLIYLLSGYGNHALNEFGFDATGRYVLMIHSALPIGAEVLCIALTDALTRCRALAPRPLTRQLPGAAIAASVAALNLLGAARIQPEQVFVSPYYTRQPATLQPLIAYLEDQGIRHVWTDVGVAHVLMFETRERILAADWYDIYGAKGLVRFPEVPLAISAAPRVAFVEVIRPGQVHTRFEQSFADLGVPYIKAYPSPDLIVIIPQCPVDPAALGDGLGYQF